MAEDVVGELGELIGDAAKARRAGFKFAEIPSAEKARTSGRSKVNAFRDGLRMLWCMTRAKLRRDGGF